MKKILLVVLALTMVLTGLFSGGQQEPAATEDGGVITIRIVAKDFPADEPANISHLRNVEAGFEAWSGKKISLELVPVPEGAYAEKVNLMLLGGDIPDLIYFQGGDEVIANQGLLVDLGPYVKNSSVMQNVLMDFNKQRLENYPYLLWLAPPRARTAVVRNDWFQEAGGKVPVTVDDYYASFQKDQGSPSRCACRDRYGKHRPEWIILSITHSELRQPGSRKAAPMFTARYPALRKTSWLSIRNSMRKGFLDNDYVTTKWDTMEDKLYTGQVAMVFGTAGIVLDIYENKLMENQSVGLTALPPAKGVSQGYAVSSAKETRGWAISATSENPGHGIRAS